MVGVGRLVGRVRQIHWATYGVDIAGVAAMSLPFFRAPARLTQALWPALPAATAHALAVPVGIWTSRRWNSHDGWLNVFTEQVGAATAVLVVGTVWSGVHAWWCEPITREHVFSTTLHVATQAAISGSLACGMGLLAARNQAFRRVGSPSIAWRSAVTAGVLHLLRLQQCRVTRDGA
jgi:hypothetical protein